MALGSTSPAPRREIERKEKPMARNDSGTSAAIGFASREKVKIFIGIALILLVIGFGYKWGWWGSHNAPTEASAENTLNPPSGTWELVNLTDKKVRPEFIDITFDGQNMTSDSYPIQNGTQSHVHTEGRRSADTLHYIEHIQVIHSDGVVIQGINEYWFKKDGNLWTGIGSLLNTEGGRDRITWTYKG
jgi:hypothetical protein